MRDKINSFLAHFRIPLVYSDEVRGPNTTKIYLKPIKYFKLNSIYSLNKELELLLNRNTIINTENGLITLTINLKDKDRVFNSIIDIPSDKIKIPVNLGQDNNYNNIILNIAEAPHIIIAGTTGSGKSVLLRSIIKQAKKSAKVLFLDGKTNTLEEVNNILDTYIDLMEDRYKLFTDIDIRRGLLRGTCDIDYFNNNYKNKLNKIIIIIDEYSDISMQDLARKRNKYNIEAKVVRLCQKARAAGIHIILATQRPDAKTLSGLIRANCPTRIGLHCNNSMESRIVIDTSGLEKLNNKGDMLIKFNGKEELTRCQGFIA